MRRHRWVRWIEDDLADEVAHGLLSYHEAAIEYGRTVDDDQPTRAELEADERER